MGEAVRSDVISALTKTIFDAMVDEGVSEIIFEAHKSIARARQPCSICHAQYVCLPEYPCFKDRLSMRVRRVSLSLQLPERSVIKLRVAQSRLMCRMTHI
jgi:hypothetical protein